MKLSDGLGASFPAEAHGGPRSQRLKAVPRGDGKWRECSAVLSWPGPQYWRARLAQAATTAKAGATTSDAINVAAVAAATDPAVVDVDTALDDLEGGGTRPGRAWSSAPAAWS